jgi:hypothetical protein
MDGKVVVNVTVAGKIYPMREIVDDEQILKKAEAFIKSKLDNYSSMYSDESIQDILTVILINTTKELFKGQRISDQRCSKIERIDRTLGYYLEKQGSLDNIE